jgi:hypothetical protein
MSSQSALPVQSQPLGSKLQPPGSRHWSTVHATPSVQVIAGPPQLPPVHVSVVVQVRPSLQPVPLGSAALHASAASLHEPAQLESVVLSGRHGLPA